jgi:hypothetical protein
LKVAADGGGIGGKSQFDTRLMRHNHYQEKFFQDESPAAENATANKKAKLQRNMT